MNKSSERPPIMAFLLTFIALVAAALSLATLSPTSEPTSNDAAAFNGRGSESDANGTGRTGRSATSPTR